MAVSQIYPGRRFGKQVLVRHIETVKKNQRWLVRCDCGSERPAWLSSVRSPGASCGCDFRVKMSATMRANGHFLNIAGNRFGRLTAVERVGDKWKCRCDCGTEAIKRLGSLRGGKTNKCRRTCPLGPIISPKTHGESSHGPDGASRLYRIWVNMRTRCSNPNVPHFHRYGGRGITVCPEWEASYEAFRDWAQANGYSAALSIDRYPDNAGNYEPSNCRWATARDQAKNRRPAQARARSDAAHEGLQDAARDAQNET